MEDPAHRRFLMGARVTEAKARKKENPAPPPSCPSPGLTGQQKTQAATHRRSSCSVISFLLSANGKWKGVNEKCVSLHVSAFLPPSVCWQGQMSRVLSVCLPLALLPLARRHERAWKERRNGKTGRRNRRNQECFIKTLLCFVN